MATGKVTATILNLAVATYLIRQNNLTNLKVAAKAELDLPGLSIGVRKDWPELVPILDKVLRSVTQEEEQAINDRWVSVRFDVATDQAAVIRIGLQVGGVAALIVIVIVIWNRSLQKEVKQRKLAETNMEAAKNEAERLTQAKSDFVAVISHEIRTPMNGVLGMARLLTETQLDKEQSECVDTVVASGEALLTIIDDLLDLSKIDAGKLEIESLPFVVDEVVEQSMALMRSRAEEKGLVLESIVDAQIPDVVVGDANRIRQIILNLISNAIKFTEEGSVAVNTCLESKIDNVVFLAFTVTDTGRGIPSDTLKKLFADYSQGSAAVARKYGGTGLGLAICRRLANMMDGEITVESAVDEGSTFCFKASFEIDNVTDVEALRTEHVTHQSSSANEPASRPLRVLQVEDNQINRTVIERILTRVGHDVSNVEDGREALEALSSGEFDVVLMDRHMPVMDGLEATRQIRKLKGRVSSIPIYGLTASASQQDIDDCMEAGMNDCFAKPVEAAKLRALLERVGRGIKSPSLMSTQSSGNVDPAAAGQDKPAIDLKNLAEILGEDDEEELFFVLGIFNEEFPKLLAGLELAIEDRDPVSVRDREHAAKGAATNAGAHGLTGMLQELEADSSLENWMESEKQSAAIKSEYARIVRFCEDHRRETKVT